MVHGERHLQAVLGDAARVEHGAGVVDEDVDRGERDEEAGGELVNGALIERNVPVPLPPAPGATLDFWQVLLGRSLLDEGEALRNVVYMGMGEPLHNYDNVKAALDILLDPDGPDFSHRHVTVSTSGLVPEMRRLGEETDVKLAVSLNATLDAQRSALIAGSLVAGTYEKAIDREAKRIIGGSWDKWWLKTPLPAAILVSLALVACMAWLGVAKPWLK